MRTLLLLSNVTARLLLATTGNLLAQANTPPVISAIPDQTTDEDVPILNIPFTVQDPETTATALKLSLSVLKADGPLLAENVVIAGTGTNRWLSLYPLADRFGTNLVTLTLTDAGGLTASRSFRVEVVPVNDPPRLSPILNRTVIVGTQNLTIPFTISDPDSSSGAITLRATNSRPAAVRDSDWRVLGMGPTNKNLVAFGPLLTPGSTAITVVASDGLARATVSFILDVLLAEFSAGQPLPPGPMSRSPAWADFDTDGDLDLFVPAWQMLLNKGSGSFGTGPVLENPPSGSAAAVADYDGDGNLDFLLYGTGTRLYRSVTGGTRFATTIAINQTLSATSSAAWADLDGDGDLDLALSSGNGTEWFRNEGRDEFTRLKGGLDGISGLLTIADYDGDGSADMLVASRAAGGTPVVRLYNNGGTGFFSDSGAALPQQITSAAGWADVNGDGQFDLWLVQALASGPNRTNTLVVLARNHGKFVETFRVPGEVFGASTNFPVWADFDNDGDIDFVGPNVIRPTGTNINIVTLYHNDGQGHFSPTGLPVGTNFGLTTPQAADFDGDGSADLLSRFGSNLTPFRNQQRRINSLPGAPSGLRAFVAGATVTLLWDAAEDANQSVPLTYNVRLGTAPGLNDVVPSMSTTNGVRMIPAAGNAGFNTWLTLNLASRRLDTDVLYWSVQAVDNSFQGGPFAPEQRFIITLPPNLPPVISGLTDVVIAEDTATTVRFVVADDRTQPRDIHVAITSSNPGLAEVPPASLSSSSTNRLFTLRPVRDQFGEATLSVVATDGGGLSTTNHLHVTVTPVNDGPILMVPDRHFGFVGQATPTVALLAHDVETPAAALEWTIQSSKPEFLPPNNVRLERANSEWSLSATSTRAEEGAADILLKVTDSDGASVQRRMRVEFVRDLLFTQCGGLPAFANLWADLDGDGAMELLSHHEGDHKLDVWSCGNGHLELVRRLEIDVGPLDVGDFDNDGDADLLTSGLAPNSQGTGTIQTCQVLRNLGGFEFERLPDFPEASALPTGFAWFLDLDQDGKLDILVDSASRGVRFYRGRGDHFVRSVDGFVAGTQLAGRTTLGLEAFYDPSGAIGALAVTAASPTQERTTFYFERQGQGFTAVAAPWGEGVVVAQADFDTDGTPDVLLGPGEQGRGLVARGADGMQFVREVLPFSVPLHRAAVADFDNDGRPDILTFAYSAAALRLGRPPLSFENADRLLPSSRIDSAAPADFDGDGILDFSFSHYTEGGFPAALLRGYSSRANRPPAAPANLQVRFQAEGRLQLVWDPAHDLDQAGGLTYNVRIGTAPGRGDVLSPMSLPNGRRLAPLRGNAGWSLAKVTTGLESCRTYYWSVQAVDNSFAGGPFAAEASFTMPTVAGGEVAQNAALALRRVGGRRHELGLCAAPNTRWQLEVSTDLITWQDFAATPSALQADTNGVARLGLELVGDRQFLRVRRMAP